ncbi:MAG: hypothetical protein KC496_06720 [Anaerolineae bacterium]|nr:hypothetical protein [Anaerolineae bacterium]
MMQDEMQRPERPENENEPQPTSAEDGNLPTADEPEVMVNAETTVSEEASDDLPEAQEESHSAEKTIATPAPVEPLPAKKQRRERPDIAKAKEEFAELVDESEQFFDKAARISDEISAETEVKDKVYERKNIDLEIEVAVESEEKPDARAGSDKPHWKERAEEIYDERSSRKQRMIEERRKMDEIIRERRQKREEALRGGEQVVRKQILEDARKRREEKEQAFKEMMQKAREEKERTRRAALGLDVQENQTVEDAQSNLDERTSRLAKDDEEQTPPEA